MAKILVCANQKGGVGKTTTAANLGSYLALYGKQVLLVDMDPQGNLTSAVGADDQHQGMYELLTGNADFSDVLQSTSVENLTIIGSNLHLAAVEVEFVGIPEREYQLKRILRHNTDRWDYVIIDCPPSLGLLTLNGLVSSDRVVIPLQCEYFALEGLSMLVKTIMNVRKKLNPDLDILGIVFTMYDSRTRLANDVVKNVSDYFQERVFKTLIPRNIRLSEAPSHGLPIHLYDPNCLGAKSYENLTMEVLARE